MKNILGLPLRTLWFLPIFVILLTLPSAHPLKDEPHQHAHAAEGLYTCGMHPQVIQEGPGTCPICAMDLTPMLESNSTGSENSKTLSIDPVTVQNMGVRIGQAEMGPIWRNIRTVGTVLAPDDGQSVVNLRFSGWIEHLYVDKEGQPISVGDPLFAIYSPELVAAQEEYHLARQRSGADSPLAKAAVNRLQNWGLPKGQIKRLTTANEPQKLVTWYAQQDGYLLHKSIDAGSYAKAGQDLLRIASLDRVWLDVQIYEFDAPYIFPGQYASIEWAHQPGSRQDAQIDYVYPTLDKQTRTLAARLELSNSDMRLKPGMSATVRLESEYQESTLTIPSEAIIRSGERQFVFVSEELGKYHPRDVNIGLVGDNGQTEITQGLSAGETVVTSGQFLLDSESQLQEAIQKMLSARLQGSEQSATKQKQDTQATAQAHNHPHKEASPSEKASSQRLIRPSSTGQSASSSSAEGKQSPPVKAKRAATKVAQRSPSKGSSAKDSMAKDSTAKGSTAKSSLQSQKILSHWFCPLHPKRINQEKAGNCPIDGLSLEPLYQGASN